MNAFTSSPSIASEFAARRALSAHAGAGRCATAAAACDPFFARFGRPLPRALRAEADGMSWSEFTAAYAPQGGPVRLGGWSDERLAAGRRRYEATIAVGDTIFASAATACGPIAAMTEMLHGLGFQIEILSFHRYDFGDTSITFLLCRSGDETAWVMGAGDDATESSLRAMIAGINRSAEK